MFFITRCCVLKDALGSGAKPKCNEGTWQEVPNRSQARSLHKSFGIALGYLLHVRFNNVKPSDMKCLASQLNQDAAAFDSCPLRPLIEVLRSMSGL